MPKILSVATAVPKHRYDQNKIERICRKSFQPAVAQARTAAVFAHAGVRSRHLVEPADYYFAGNSFEAKNKNYLKHALDLATRCLRAALCRAGKDFPNVSHIISLTTTGLLTPSLEAHLAQALPFPRNVKRTPIFGVGCAGAAVGLARAGEYLKGHPDELILLLSVELCSLTFIPEERGMTQLIGTALFGDGAAAALIAGNDAKAEKPRAEILGSESLLLPDSLGVMGWDFGDRGMRLVLSPGVCRLVERHFEPAVAGFLARLGVDLTEIDHFLFHPGSAKVIKAFEKALGLSPHDTRRSRRFLRNFGNLSSASLLFILEDVLKREKPRPGSLGLIAALGPGFSCELSLLRFW